MRSLPFYILFTFLLPVAVWTQSADQWMRIQTDDGKFSIEVPAEHKYLFSRDGFIVSRERSDYLTSNMSMLTAYSNGTLLSVEVYDASPAALSAIMSKDKNTEWNGGPDEKIGSTKVQVIDRKGDDAFARSKYFSHDGKIFILLAASRNGINASIERFFDSVDLESKGVTVRPGTELSKLKRSDLTTRDVDPPPAPKADPKAVGTKPPPPDPSLKKFVLIRRFASSYVPKARSESVSGNIKLRVHFAKDGFIPHIDVYEKLGGGLLRQTLYAAARIRYLPEEKDGVPVTISRPVSYSFRIY